MSYDAASETWTWTGGDSQVVETYTAGKLRTRSDSNGNTITYHYDAADLRLEKIEGADGSYLEYSYLSGDVADADFFRVASIKTVDHTGAMQSRNAYYYDCLLYTSPSPRDA